MQSEPNMDNSTLQN